MASPLNREPHVRLQNDVLDLLARGVDLVTQLEALCRGVETLVPHSVCSAMRLDTETGKLFVAAAPSIPEEILRKLDGLEPGAFAAACGTAIHTRELVIIEDARSDPRFADFQDLVSLTGMRGCWSMPVFSTDRQPLGTLAISRTVPGAPDAGQLETLRLFAKLGSIGFLREHDLRALADKNALLESILESAQDPIFAKDLQGRYVALNSADARELVDMAQARDLPLAVNHNNVFAPAFAKLLERANELQIGVPPTTSTPYINTIPAEQQPFFPGNEDIERRIRAFIRWNAAAMVIATSMLAGGSWASFTYRESL